jgi:hypothetical protein
MFATFSVGLISSRGLKNEFTVERAGRKVRKGGQSARSLGGYMKVGNGVKKIHNHTSWTTIICLLFAVFPLVFESLIS